VMHQPGQSRQAVDDPYGIRLGLAPPLATGPSPQRKPSPAPTALPGKFAYQSEEKILQAVARGSVTLH
jgi:hypothetical protein